INLRWPTAREISGPWLRALALARPTIVVDLAHLGLVPSLDPRTWLPHQRSGSGRSAPPICVAVDIVDEVHSLKLAMRRRAPAAAWRDWRGRVGQHYGMRKHPVTAMVEDSRRVIARAMSIDPPVRPLPPHATDDNSEMLRRLLEPFGVASPLG